MDFKHWVDDVGGVAQASMVLKEKPRTVLSWYYGEKSPRLDRAQNIVTKTKGLVDFNGLYGPLAQKSAKEKKC